MRYTDRIAELEAENSSLKARVEELEAEVRVKKLVIKRLDEGMTILRNEKDAEIESLKSKLEEEKKTCAAMMWKYCDYISQEEYKKLEDKIAKLSCVLRYLRYRELRPREI